MHEYIYICGVYISITLGDNTYYRDISQPIWKIINIR